MPLSPLTLLQRNYLSTHHLWNARHQADLAAEIEATHTGRDRFDVRHRGYVISAVISAAAFLEAAINEVFCDAIDNHGDFARALPPTVKASLRLVWDDGYGEVAEKFQAALACRRRRPVFDTSREPFQSVTLLILLRNRLVHPMPITLVPGDAYKLARQLKPKLVLNTLMTRDKGPLYPNRVLGAGCAKWAVSSAETFASEFFKRMKLRPNYQRTQRALTKHSRSSKCSPTPAHR